jgi:predicted ATP-grasp superfamily ATP-dependent carboligase
MTMIDKIGEDGNRSSLAVPCARPDHPAAEYDALILDGATRQSLASARSLGRAGLRVAVGECYAECDPGLPVLAFRSRYSARTVVLPSFAADAAAFAGGVEDFVRQHPTPVVLPASDGAIAALLPRRDQLAALGTLLALPGTAAMSIASDKAATLAAARELGLHTPRTMQVRAMAGIPAMLAAFTFPFVLKPAIPWPDRCDRRLQGREVMNEAEATACALAFLDAGAPVLAQELAPGRREGITLFTADGEVLASFAHAEHRTSPPLGGASVLRESIAMPPDSYAAAVRLAAGIGLDGLCEVEFRRSAAGLPLLMEINARLAGHIEIAMHAGMDFPLMAWRRAAGQPVAPVHEYLAGYRMRWLRGDMRWLRDNCRQVGRPDGLSRSRALWTFTAEFARTRHYDCLDRRDLRPVLAELRTTAAALRKWRGPQPLVPGAAEEEKSNA